MKNLITGFIAAAVLILVGLGCSNADDKSANTSNTTSNTSSNDGKSNSTTSTSKKDDIEGTYGITGTNPSNQSYQGDLTIKKQDEVYQFSWSVGGSAYDGVGVREDDLIAVGYGAGDNGKGCGSAIYKIGDKMLEGKMGGWGFNNVGKQTAILLKQSKEGGLYTVSGTDTDGSTYSGDLFVATSKSDVYQFAFGNNGKPKYVGTGIKVDDYFGAGVGLGKKCGFAVYQVKSDRLEAAWGIIGDGKLGVELAKRK